MLSVGANTKGAPVLTYVYSGSMEPLIKVNDAFLVWPSSHLKVGDIIMYRPTVLKAPYITHRIVAIGENGFITKGDNAPYRDQESGEPEVLPDRIIGKVVTINGQPVIIPRLGVFSAYLKGILGGSSKYLAAFFMLLGFTSLLLGNRNIKRVRKPRHRLRLRDIYKSIVIIAVILVVISIYFGSRVTKIEYLVTEYPGTLGDQVGLDQPGKLTLKVSNHGFVPVWAILSGITPISAQNPPEYISARSSKTTEVDVLPQHQTGIYQGYVQVYNYPTLLPRAWIVYLHNLNPIIAIMAVGASIGLIFTVFFKFLSSIHGFEDWIPLKAIRDKIFDRRLKHARSKIIGRRRGR